MRMFQKEAESHIYSGILVTTNSSEYSFFTTVTSDSFAAIFTWSWSYDWDVEQVLVGTRVR